MVVGTYLGGLVVAVVEVVEVSASGIGCAVIVDSGIDGGNTIGTIGTICVGTVC